MRPSELVSMVGAHGEVTEAWALPLCRPSSIAAGVMPARLSLT